MSNALICEVRKCEKQYCNDYYMCEKGCYKFDKKLNTLSNYRKRTWRKKIGKFELKDIKTHASAYIANYFINKKYIDEHVDSATFYY